MMTEAALSRGLFGCPTRLRATHPVRTVAAPSLGIELVFAPIENDAADVERAIAAFARAAPK
jgi:hypothetical protein